MTKLWNTFSANCEVRFEVHDNAISAITREKQLKKWNREWKINLIEQENPTWRDLFSDITS